MQGQLTEISLPSLFQFIELEQKTGVLFINTQNFSSEYLIFFNQGTITYAADHTHSNLFRLQDYLCYYKIEHMINQISLDFMKATTVPEYGLIWCLSQQGVLTTVQARSIIQAMIQEVLFDVLRLPQGFFIFENTLPLMPQVINFEISILIKKMSKQLQQWQQFYPYIYTPEQCPLITNQLLLHETGSKSSYNSLYNWADGKNSLRQISRYLHRDLLTIAKTIYPYIKQGLIEIVTTEKLTVKKRSTLPILAYISDEQTYDLNFNSLLSNLINYEIIHINELNRIGELLLQVTPGIIFCQCVHNSRICAMLRQVSLFEQIPIIILMEQENFVEQLKLKSQGATDFLYQPWSKFEVSLLLKKYLKLKPNCH